MLNGLECCSVAMSPATAAEYALMLTAAGPQPGTAAAPGGGRLSARAFQPIGLPVDPADFQSSPLQAVAATDALADVTAKAADGQYVPTPVSATGLFDLLLSGAVAAAGDAATYGVGSDGSRWQSTLP